MQAVILAAGLGKRLRHKTRDNTKCMVEVNGRKLIDRSLENMTKAPLSRIVIVIGYEGEKLRQHVGESYNGVPILYVENPVYASTNNIYSLALAAEYLAQEDTLLFESDLIYDEKIVARLLADPNPNVAVVDKYTASMDGTVVTINGQNDITAFIPKKHFDYRHVGEYYKTVNIYKFSREFLVNSYIPFLRAYSTAMGNNQYYEQVLRVLLTLEKGDIKAMPLSGEKWYEIDDLQDLSNAELLFKNDIREKLAACRKRHGGYWRFHGFHDYCHLANPYFPPKRMMEEFKYSFTDLLTNHPSGEDVQKLLVGNVFDVMPESVLVGNGTEGLVSGLMAALPGRIGLMSHTFQKYPAHAAKEALVQLTPSGEGFRYTAKDLLAPIDDIDTLCLTNPDNPSGNFIPKEDILRLTEAYNRVGKMVVIDESFVDFSSAGEQNSLVHQDILDSHPNLTIVKSISQSYGVPGVCLGFLASGNAKLLAAVRRSLPVQNINSYGEFFLQALPKYRAAYADACAHFAEVRDTFLQQLAEVKGLTVYPSQANYCLCKVTAPMGSAGLCCRLFKEYDILIKDCSGTFGFGGQPYVRIAVKSEEENALILRALKRILG